MRMTDEEKVGLYRECRLYELEKEAGHQQSESEKEAYGRMLMQGYGDDIRHLLSECRPYPRPLPFKVRWRRFKERIRKLWKRDESRIV